MLSRILVAVLVVTLAGCGSPAPDSTRTAPRKIVQSGPGIIGTWEGTESGPAAPSGTSTTPNTEQFDTDGTYTSTEETASVPLTPAGRPRTIHSVISGTYTYDEKAKTLKMKMLKETTNGIEATITESSSSADQAIPVTWVGKDEISFTRGSVNYSLKRKA